MVTDDVEVTISYAPLCFMTYEDVEEYFANKEFVPICTIPIGPKEYFSTWTLYESEGGIKAPLDSWGYKNATLMEVESCVKVDLNARQIVAHAASDYGDRTWTPSPYSDDVYIIESDDTEKILILVRS